MYSRTQSLVLSDMLLSVNIVIDCRERERERERDFTFQNNKYSTIYVCTQCIDYILRMAKMAICWWGGSIDIPFDWHGV